MNLKSPSIVSQLFEDSEATAFTLYTVCVSHFGSKIHEWEPETLWLEIIDDFKVDVEESNKDKIQAAIALVVTNKFYEDYRAFEGICKAFNSQSPDFEWSTPLSPEEASWGVAESRLIDETPEIFALEIEGYVRELLRYGGLLAAPPQLSFCKMSSHYPIEKYTDPSLRKKVMEWQKIKLGKTEVHVSKKKEKIEHELREYFQ